VGKQGGQKCISQGEINQLLIAKAAQHRHVVRLKGGDPFIFGRGGEEALALTAAHVPWEAVPGVSSALGATAYAGIPLTFRGVSSSVAFITAHEDPAKEHSTLHWDQLATGADTLVVFMGVARIQPLVEALLAQGRPAATPVAVIRWGTYAHQEVYVSDLQNIAALVTVSKSNRRADHRRRSRSVAGTTRLVYSTAISHGQIMRYYPLHLDLQNRAVLVVGGGVIAEGKAEQLLAAGARLTVVSPTLTPRFTEWTEQDVVDWRRGEFSASDLTGQTLVICATDQPAVNEAVAHAAAAAGILYNVVDQPALCNFITPALVTRGNLQISISTAGGSPSVAQLVKRRIAETIGDEYGALLELAAQLRQELKQAGIGYNQRRDLLNEFVESAALTHLRNGQPLAAAQLAQAILDRIRKQP
jgi:uroporphyrin-III C-methyltransferase